MLAYILFTYLILLLVLALSGTVDSSPGLVLLVLVVMLTPWLLLQLVRLVRRTQPPPD